MRIILQIKSKHLLLSNSSFFISMSRYTTLVSNKQLNYLNLQSSLLQPFIYVFVNKELRLKVIIKFQEQGNRRSTLPALCTLITPFPADPICSERGSDGMIPSAA